MSLGICKLEEIHYVVSEEPNKSNRFAPSNERGNRALNPRGPISPTHLTHTLYSEASLRPPYISALWARVSSAAPDDNGGSRTSNGAVTPHLGSARMPGAFCLRLIKNSSMSTSRTAFVIHPQLLADCHCLGRLPATHLLLHHNAAVPWFILVPETEQGNLLDLALTQREAVLADCKRVSDYVVGSLGCAKVNVAWIGNLVPQLHIHVIGRDPLDNCWPRPVWGHLTETLDYHPEDLTAHAVALVGV